LHFECNNVTRVVDRYINHVVKYCYYICNKVLSLFIRRFGIIMKISYNAVIQYDDDGIWVMFPDLKGCFSTGDENRIEEMAKEAMELYLDDMDVESLPRPTSISDFNLEDNQRAVNITCDFEVRNMRGIK